MEKTYHKVRVLFFLNDFHPFFGGGFQLLEAQSGAQTVGHPSDYVRRQKTKHGDFITVAVENNIRCEVRLASRLVDDIGGQNRHLELGVHPVENLFTCFNIVVSNTNGIVREEIEHLRNQIGMLGIMV